MANRNLDAPGFQPLDRQRTHAHDEHFIDDYILPAGGEVYISRDLARQLGYQAPQPAFTAGSEPEDGEQADNAG